MLIFILALAVSQASNNATICADYFPDDFVMQKSCREQMGAGQATYAKLLEKAPAGAKRAVEKCKPMFTREVGTDWSMVASCAKQQIDAFNSM